MPPLPRRTTRFLRFRRYNRKSGYPGDYPAQYRASASASEEPQSVCPSSRAFRSRKIQSYLAGEPFIYRPYHLPAPGRKRHSAPSGARSSSVMRGARSGQMRIEAHPAAARLRLFRKCVHFLIGDSRKHPVAQPSDGRTEGVYTALKDYLRAFAVIEYERRKNIRAV